MSYTRTTLIRVCISFFVVSLIGCDIQEKKERKSKSTYVKPYVTQSGKLVRGKVRKSFVVGSIKKGFESRDHLSLVKVSRLIGHGSVSTTLRFTNFETNQMLDLYELS